MWHAYKYCVIECYRRFLPLSEALQCKPFLTDFTRVEILANFNVPMMDSMVLSVIPHTSRMRPVIRT